MLSPNQPEFPMSKKVKDVVKLVTRTAIGGQVLSAIHLGKSHHIYEHSTVHELVNDAVAVPFQPRVPTVGKQECEPYNAENDVDNIELGYLCIGINGHTSITDSNGITNTLPIAHKATDCGLYQIVPFAVKQLDNDLTDEQRRKYRLRKIIEIDGVLYAAYYLRKLHTDETPTTVVINSVNDGRVNSSIWKPTIADLRPTKPNIGYDNDASYITVVSNVSVTFDEEDIENFLDAMELLYGNSNYAITELGYCTAVDKPIVRQYPTAGAQTPSTAISRRGLKEVVGCQIAYFINTVIPASVFNKRFTYTIDLGINEPLFTTRQNRP